MKKIFVFVMLIVSINLCTFAAGPVKTCAVIPFGGLNKSQLDKAEDLRIKFESIINDSTNFKTIPNTRKKLIKADYFNKQYSSVISAAMTAGIILDADYVIFGQINHSGNQYSITTTLVDAHTSKAIRSVRSKVDGDINLFIAEAPASNLHTLLNIKTAQSSVPFFSPKVSLTTPTSTKNKTEKLRKKKKITYKTPKRTHKSLSRLYHHNNNFSSIFSSHNYEELDFNEMEYENSFMNFIANHLEIGTRVVFFSLTDSSGEFLGTINKLKEEQNGAPTQLFATWMFLPYVGVDFSWTHVKARTYTDSADSHSDGSIEMSGPAFSILGRYPVPMHMGDKTFIMAPYASLGFAMLSRDFETQEWWTLGYGSPTQWEEYGQPTTSLGGYHREINVSDSTEFVLAGGLAIQAFNGLSVDLYLRYMPAEADATFTRRYNKTGYEETLNGSFTLDSIGYGVGIRYSF